MTRLRECESGRGSVAMYVVVGVILAGALLGGIYLSRHGLLSVYNGNNNQSVKVADDSNSATNKGGGSNKPSTDLKNQTNDSDTKKKDTGANNQNSQPKDKGNSATNLPATGTGISGVFLEAVGLSALVLSTAYYIRSRSEL